MNILELMRNFGKDAAKFIQAGMPVVTAEEFKDRLETCNSCDLLKDNGSCSLCGCHMAVKAKWATAVCPHKPTKWKEIKKK